MKLVLVPLMMMMWAPVTPREPVQNDECAVKTTAIADDAATKCKRKCNSQCSAASNKSKCVAECRRACDR